MGRRTIDGAVERRRKTRGKKAAADAIVLWVEKRDGSWQKIPARVQDSGEYGLGILLSEALREGQSILIEGGGIAAPGGGRARGHIAWCGSGVDGTFRAGVALDDEKGSTGVGSGESEDLYEVLEVNPTASFDTIHKIYRVLAQRVHPDNPESGSEELFKKLVQAYRVLSDPEQRAAYDVVRQRTVGRQWRIFDPESAAPGLEQEQRKRRAILSLLYNRRMRTPEQCGVGIQEMEQLLAVPREHLEFPLWFLKEQGWVQRTDGAKHHITAKGVEHAEVTGAWQPPMVQHSKLLQAGLAG